MRAVAVALGGLIMMSAWLAVAEGTGMTEAAFGRSSRASELRGRPAAGEQRGCCGPRAREDC
jgi:hypothetical protein